MTSTLLLAALMLASCPCPAGSWTWTATRGAYIEATGPETARTKAEIKDGKCPDGTPDVYPEAPCPAFSYAVQATCGCVGLVFADGFETKDTGNWSKEIP